MQGELSSDEEWGIWGSTGSLQVPASGGKKPGPGSSSPSVVSTVGRMSANPWGEKLRKSERAAQPPAHHFQEKLPLNLDILIFYTVPSFEQKDTTNESWVSSVFVRPRGGVGGEVRSPREGVVVVSGSWLPRKDASNSYLFKMLILETSSG